MKYEKQFNSSVNDLGKVAVLFGGTAAEREISLRSGNAVLNALIDLGVDATGIDCQENWIAQLQKSKFDRAFIVLHGVGGEDGKAQAVLECLNIPFTGSDHASSALGMDKLKTKQVWSSVNIPTASFEVLNIESDWHAVLNRMGGVGFVKPVHEGSSIGMAKVQSAIELEQAFNNAHKYDSTVIVESFIDGPEYTISILNGVVLPTVQVKAANEFYDYEAKYFSNNTQYLCPCDLDKEKERELQTLAKTAFDVVGCSGWGRVDLMLDQHGNPFLLEVNTVPGMTSSSLVPMAAKEAGLSFEELVLEILSQSVDS